MALKEALNRHHGLVMMAGCIAVFAVIFVAVRFFGVPQGNLYWLLLLLCPLMHLFMMKNMHKGREEEGDKGQKKGGGCH